MAGDPGERRSGGEEDALLIRRYRAGDHLALEELVRRHYRTVFNLAYRLTNDYNNAQDILSEAFIRVQNALPGFRGEATFSTWLYRVVRNVFLDEQKKARIRSHASLEEMIETDDSVVSRQVEDRQPGPSEVMEQAERAEILKHAVASLPDTQRLMISLYHFQHLSYEEIAEIMDLPIGTVKSRLNRARLALRSRLMSQRDVLDA